MKKGKRLLAASMAILMGASLFACSNQTDENSGDAQGTGSSTSAASKVDLRVLTTFAGTDAYAPVYQEVIKEFQNKYPNVSITDESMSGDGDPIRVKVKTEFASNSEPDVMFYFTQSEAETLVKSGRLMEFDDLLTQDGEWGDSFLTSALDQMKVNDKIYSLPLVGIYEQMFYNKDLFDANNLTIPKTWDELLNAVKVFKQKDIVPIANSIKDNWCVLSETLTATAGAGGIKSTFQDGVNSDWAKGLDSIKQLYEQGAFPKDALTLQDSVAQQLFVNKKAAMMFSGSWAVANMKDQSNVVVAPMPLPDGGKGSDKEIIAGFTSGYYLSKASYENKDKDGMALKLIQYLTSEDVVKKFVEASGAPSAVKLSSDVDISELAKQGNSYVTNASDVTLSIDSLVPSECYNTIAQGLPYIVTGQKTSTDVLNSAYQIYQSTK